jgi:hypothetical protein
LVDNSINYSSSIKREEFKLLQENPKFYEAAKQIHPGTNIIYPCNVYANVLLPGQELAIHTDVPEFLGAAR